jgi:hypothetical protein
MGYPPSKGSVIIHCSRRISGLKRLKCLLRNTVLYYATELIRKLFLVSCHLWLQSDAIIKAMNGSSPHNSVFGSSYHTILITVIYIIRFLRLFSKPLGVDGCLHFLLYNTTFHTKMLALLRLIFMPIVLSLTTTVHYHYSAEIYIRIRECVALFNVPKALNLSQAAEDIYTVEPPYPRFTAARKY